MELIIETEEFKVKVNTDLKDFKIGDIICCYVQEFPGIEGEEDFPSIPAYWYLKKVESIKVGKFLSLVDKHYKVIEIYEEV